MKKIIAVVLLASLCLCMFTGCSSCSGCSGCGGKITRESPEYRGILKLAIADTTADIDIAAEFGQDFLNDSGWELECSGGSEAEVFERAKNGGVDMIMTTNGEDAQALVSSGVCEGMYQIIVNDYVLVGPTDGMVEAGSKLDAAFDTMKNNNLVFIARGDGSIAGNTEAFLWRQIGIDMSAYNNYIVSGARKPGDALGMANDMKAYTITDRASWLKYKKEAGKDLKLDVICGDDARLQSSIIVMPVIGSDSEKLDGCKAFIDWMRGETAQKFIAKFGKKEYGEPLFTPAVNFGK